ncbi:tetratricopeptide repeat protein [Thermodesulfobacteriota bacterium]
MRSLLKIVCALVLIVPIYTWLAQGVWTQRIELRKTAEAGYSLPARFSNILAVDYQGVLSDYQFLKIITFYGGRIQYEQSLSEEDWRYVVQGLETVTELDPYFMDAYLLAESLLAWEASRVEEANDLLKKGMSHVTNWRLPFYISCNYFLFLKDYASAAEYMKKASRLPDSPGFLATLAARLDYYAGKSDTAILFLSGLLAETSDPSLRQRLEKRMLALQRAVDIEKSLQQFKNEHGRMPIGWEELVNKGTIGSLPQDPYGGEWVLLENGRVFSTSKFAEVKSESKSEQPSTNP